MRFLITRPAEDAKTLAEKLGRLGHMSVIEPLISIVMRDWVTWPAKPYQAIVLSSANAARALGLHQNAASLLAIKVFTVGRQSAEAARAAGFRDVTAGEGSMAQLAATLSATLAPSDGAILYLSGEDIAADLQGMLRNTGFDVERAVLYKAEEAAGLSGELQRSLRTGQIAGVFLYSPRTASIWRRLVERAGLAEKVRPLLHLCLSANVAAALGKDYVKAIAEQPEESSLLKLLDRLR